MLPYCLMFHMSLPDDILNELRKVARPISVEEVEQKNLYEQITVACASPMRGLDDEWFDKLPHLKLISVFGVGTDKINLQKASAHHVVVATTLNILTREVTNLAFTFILGLTRMLKEADLFVRSGAWGRGQAFPLSHSVIGKRLGIIGLGAIGHDIGKRGQAFGMIPAYYNRTQKKDVTWPYYESVAALAKESDILVAAIAATPQTNKLINAQIFDALGPQGIFINIARGAVVDEEDLIHALQEKRIGAAGLDVFLNEPNINPAFFTLDNVLLTPHQGSATVETRTMMGMCVVENIKAVLGGQPALTPVN